MTFTNITVNGQPVKLYTDDWLHERITKKWVPTIKRDDDFVAVVDGGEGCLTGDTLIQVSRNKLSKRYSLDWMYNNFHNNPDKILPKKKHWNLKSPSFVRAFNGKDIRLHKIKDVVYSGIKKVYKLSLENGYSIKATADHKIMTINGWVELKDLTESSLVMCDTLKAENNHRIKIKLYDVALKTYYHPFTKNNRVEVHRLIYEARLNNLQFLEYMDILLNEPEKSKTLIFIDPAKYHIHHKDGCHYNNSIENLEVLEKSKHMTIHSNNAYSNFSQGIPKFSKVISIEELGEEKTYDIVCEEPYHNFVANGIIVHNSGKSVFAQQIAKLLDPDFDIQNICMNANEFKKRIKECKRGTCIVYDEAFTGLSSKGALTEINKILVELMMEMRQKNLKVLIVLPTFFMLEKYVALFRARCLFHIYRKQNKRGYWLFFGRKKKKLLYLLGKKFLSYKEPRSERKGRFQNTYTVDEKAYRQKKENSFVNKEHSTREDKWKLQRTILLWYLTQKFGITLDFISDLMYPFGIELDSGNTSKDLKALNEKIQAEIENPPDDLLIGRFVDMVNRRNCIAAAKEHKKKLEFKALNELAKEKRRLIREANHKKKLENIKAVLGDDFKPAKTPKNPENPKNQALGKEICQNQQKDDIIEQFMTS